MKKLRLLSLAAALLLLLAACSGKNAAEYNLGDSDVDLDLTRLSSSMVYSEVYNMRYEPDGYYGKLVRIRGIFSVYSHPDTGEPLFNCIIPDATSCCAQGLQFFPVGELAYPDDFPENGQTVTIKGTFSLYEENIYLCAITDAVFETAQTG